MEKAVILIIDDDPNLRETLTDILKLKGYEALAAKDGEEGLAVMEQNPANVVLIDLGLPGMSGMEVLERIKADRPMTEAIILTGNATLDPAIEATNRGAFSYVVKPYDIEQLLLQLRRAIEKQKAEETQRESEERFRKIFELGPLGMSVMGMNYGFIKVNRMFCGMTGYTDEELAGLKCIDITHPEDIEIDVQNAERLLRGDDTSCVREKRFIRKNGEIMWANLTASLIRSDGGTPLYFLGMVEDISERKRYAEQLEYQSNHDGLTGLPSQNLLNDRIRQAIFFASRHRRGVAVLFIDLDQFKYINDSLGREVGDRLLKDIAGRLKDCLRTVDTVARPGGDEFVVVLADLNRVEDAGQVAQKIHEAVSIPIRMDEHELVVSCSIGISVYPSDGDDAQTLLKNADLAMYRAKEEGRNNFQFFTEVLNTRAIERITTEKHLRRALERKEFLLHFQPQIDLNTGRVSGAEALLRWQSPELGFLPPGRFIPLAEETGLIVPIGEWVLNTACAQNKRWQDAGLPRLTMAVNLSPRQFWQEDLPELVDRALRETGLDPKYLELEIVESMLMRDPDKATEMLNRLNDLGVRLAMDDFGTGYSSLNYLKRFPLDRMKIDRSFVCDVTSDPESAAIVRTIIAMAGSLNLRVTAEGVETEGQMAFLRANGCDEMQGFYFSRPVPSGEFEQMLLENRRLELAMESGRARDRTLLLVDDEVDVIASLKRTFYDEGYTIFTACSAAEGFNLLAANRVGVIVSDQRMPGMNGSEFLMRVKELYPDTIRLILTAYADIDTITETINKGAIFKFLTKPCEDDLLRENIREAFRYYELVYGKCNRPE